VVLVTFDVTDETETPQVLRVATRRYTTVTQVYRGRLVDFELDWEMEPGVEHGSGTVLCLDYDRRASRSPSF
jgi:hypothetical protein